MPLYAFKGQQPTLAARAWVAPSADVIGAVRLGEDVGVWFGATIRGDNTEIAIGPRSNVQEGCTLHSDPGVPLTIGADCTIGHRAILHGCTLGERVLIGMGAIVLNRAVIGDDCLVGAGALVTEGKVFPPRSLIIGSPARAVRELDDAAVAALRLSAAHYVENAHTAAATLERIGAPSID
ncbi:gamma carbonic anhydrase family protein [Sphingomonas yunnanensis]|uniref:gamma carbonic anhydrase family protein n=1 Tax=Sphingomonas yunnanensis TaxID=310400 RepID=UPI001CA76193|nr:gamma carbonic anhydrase family protein [Sphingomonas yunnanensis]MBY9062019.1 gamma carbonic anhydrase family protein [Sphingomonas yunnanensis]